MPFHRVTPTELATLEQTGDAIRRDGIPPTIRELMAVDGIVANAMADRLKAMRRKGMIEKEPRIPRSVRVLPPPRIGPLTLVAIPKRENP